MPEGFSSDAPIHRDCLNRSGELRQQLTSVAQRVERIEGRLSPVGAAPPAPFAASANPSQAVVLPPVKPPVRRFQVCLHHQKSDHSAGLWNGYHRSPRLQPLQD
jgi:hypothetical protein